MQQSNSQTKKSSKTLASVLKYMEDTELIVELKTGERWRGVLDQADEFMNLELKEFEKEEQEAKESGTKTSSATENEAILTPTLRIRGTKIRYIHFPDNADLRGMVRTGVDRERAASNKYKRAKRKTRGGPT